MMHEMHHSVLLAQWSAEVRHTLTVVLKLLRSCALDIDPAKIAQDIHSILFVS
jgi:hypothetical protein